MFEKGVACASAPTYWVQPQLHVKSCFMRLLWGVTLEQTLGTSVAGKKTQFWPQDWSCWTASHDMLEISHATLHPCLFTHTWRQTWLEHCENSILARHQQMRDTPRRDQQMIKRGHMQNSPDLATRKKKWPRKRCRPATPFFLRPFGLRVLPRPVFFFFKKK